MFQKTQTTMRKQTCSVMAARKHSPNVSAHKTSVLIFTFCNSKSRALQCLWLPWLPRFAGMSVLIQHVTADWPCDSNTQTHSCALISASITDTGVICCSFTRADVLQRTSLSMCWETRGAGREQRFSPGGSRLRGQPAPDLFFLFYFFF